ncbi:restriction endonuclease subunit S [Lactobacillus delbrueckii]|uniref:restriction endonuclease subunit S n=1 Tax=Lactobacillus delbrueckii TaxID=1584 RepID=UPI001E5999A3|nr:restriction endonuclease subunit S [Lactobacillus delbrueckii]MCD5476151.1 restriction endonuclease subunit S [Lactobacillus delbrueckii subsp. bulgaricus]MCT3498308.1 restriction endonuclease subunit S [Lactobacillus delbrueckii subsp. bulgaricus]MCT3576362.1 restriction endonuclease subunit S [Lactobacillus delbrueckii]
MKDEKKAPKLRFKGFTDDWEQCKLGDVCEEVSGNNGNVKGLPILTISAANGWMNQKDRFSQVIAGNELKKYTLLKKGHLAYNHGNSKQAKYGTVFVQNLYDQALVPRVYHSFKMKTENNPYYVEYYFATKKLDRELARLVTSGARMDGLLNINKKDFFKIKFEVPTPVEQSLIGTILQKLDQTITLHEEKKRQLERLKSALLQKMFADKSGYPPVRFEGFSDKWEQVKYGEIFQRRSKMGVSTPTLPSVEYDDINPGMGTLNKEPKSKGISKRGIYFNPGDVLFGKLRPYLKNWLFACFEGVAVGDFWVLTSSKIDHGFTYSLIQTPGFQYIANLSSGSKMPRSDWGLVSNARTFIPINHLEQERISSVLFGLDHAITLYEHKLEILNKIKSFLLQNMFI